MDKSIVMKFLSDAADENDGLGDAGIETFKDSVYASLARETAQNSADAWVKKPVKMTFDQIEIDRLELPGLTKLESTVEICLDQAKNDQDQKGIDFFTQASIVLKSDKIKILQVADYNTKGLIGPSERGKPFHSLVKGTGVSTKDSDTSGGSFGIGKNAAFAVSELQTVFYSSRYTSPEGLLSFICQGKTILVSHKDEDGEPRKGKAYWGVGGFDAIVNPAMIPSWLRREEQGTSIFSAAFRFQKSWQHKMASSLITNFFYAIHKGDMEFSINEGEIKLNENSLSSYFEKQEIIQGAYDTNSLEAFTFAKSLFKCIISDRTKEKEFYHDALGKISVKILADEGLPKRLALIRNGMLITDSLEHFGDKFAKFPMSKDFVAVVEAREKKGNALIKTLENPRHDTLSAERLHDPEKRHEATIAVKELAKFIRSSIKEATITIPDKEVTVDELTEFFADNTSKERSNDPEHEDDLETFIYKVGDRKGIQTPRQQASNNGRKPNRGKSDSNARKDKGNANGSFDHKGKGVSASTNQSQTQGQDAESGSGAEVFELEVSEIRNVFVEKNGNVLRRVFFTSPMKCEVQVSIQATGMNDIEELKLIYSPNANIVNNKVSFSVSENERATFDVAIAENYKGPIEIIAYTTGGSNENK